MGSSPSRPESGTRKSFRKGTGRAFARRTAGQQTATRLSGAGLTSSHAGLSPDANVTQVTVLSPTHRPTSLAIAVAPGPAPKFETSTNLTPNDLLPVEPESSHDSDGAPVVTLPSVSTLTPGTPKVWSAPIIRQDPPTSVEPVFVSTIPLAPQSTQKPSTARIWAQLETSLRALYKSAGALPPIQTAVGLFITCLDLMQDLSKSHAEGEELASELINLSNLVTQHLYQCSSAQMSGAIANVAQGLEEQLKIVQGCRNGGTGWKLLEANIQEEQLNRCYRQIRALFRQLQADASLSIWSNVNDQMANYQLDRLAPVHLAKYDSTISTSISRRTCTADTRTAILSGLKDWSHDPNQAAIYWIDGMAGTGKTTIACTFSEWLGLQKQLAASFFCTRAAPECHMATRIIPTIAYQLACYSIPFRSALCQSLQGDRDVNMANITKQFDQLLKEPLLKVKGAIPSNLVVVVDALDECDNMREVELLLSLLLKHIADLPIRFLVTSRPEPEIYERMKVATQALRVLHLHEVERSLVQMDIELYLKAELKAIALTTSQLEVLKQRSGVLFIYAATLMRYIQSHRSDPLKRLESVLTMGLVSTKQHAEIDGLYTAVLEAALDNGLEDRETENIRRVLRAVVCAEEPVSIGVLTQLAGLTDERQTLVALEPLRAVLHLSETSGLVSTLHASFPDFLFNKTRSGVYFCDSASHNVQPAFQCFEVMELQLRFNICELDSSFVPDSKVEDLDGRVKRAISPELWYVCRYWADHLRKTSYSESLCAMLDEFLLHRLLFWMEVLNLKREIIVGVEMLAKVKSWLPTSLELIGLARRIEDCLHFVTSFAANPVSQSTPHIYISALPFCPRSSFVFSNYYKKTVGLINVTGNVMDRREVAALASWDIESGICSIAYSPDGSRVAYGCKDGTIAIRSANSGTVTTGPIGAHTGPVSSIVFSPNGTRIVSCSKGHSSRLWDAMDGTLLADSLEGYIGPLDSLAYSPDGTRIVSGCKDKAIRIWSSIDGTVVAGPFEGHNDLITSVAYSPDGTRIISGSLDKTIRVWRAEGSMPVDSPRQVRIGKVRSVAYSPDGTRIISGSSDDTIRVWNATDGTPVAGPLEGHTSSVWSVAYSPDGTRIVSGSNDKTIRVWNALDGTLVTGPLEGHSGLVHSVAFSPDGARVVSGSDDNTLRVWNAVDGALVIGPLLGHTKLVSSVSYSPNGARIVSGSFDRTIRVWNATDGVLVAGPLEGHTGRISAVAYSPDGTRIISGSNDRTIRVWDATDGTLIMSPLEGHTSWVQSIAYSPDGTRIVSGSKDRTIRVWDATNGALIMGPLEGHTQGVYSIAYSPNGNCIVSGSEDNTIRVWNVAEGTFTSGISETHAELVSPVASLLDSGWVTSDSSLIFWIPHELRFGSMTASLRCQFVISTAGTLLYDYSGLVLGQRWAACFRT